MALFGPSKLDKQIGQSMNRIQGLQLAPEMRTAYQQSQALAGQGMDAASRQLAIQEAARGQNAMFGALRGKRSILGAAAGLNASSGDFALKLAAQDAAMRRENKMAGIQTGMQIGQAQNELQRYQAEAQYNELAAKKARRAQTLSGIMGAVGSIAGAALTGGAGGGLGKIFGGASKLAKTANTVAGVADTASNLFTAADAGMNILGSNYGKFKKR